MFKDNILSGQVAVVTGGGTGIGKGIALEFAKVGADVVVASRKMENLEKVASEIRALGRRSLAIQTDVRNTEQVDEMVKRTVSEFGKLDILVNNAAGNFRVPAEELSINGWLAVVNIVLNGTFYCSRAAAKVMIPLKRGKIINITSTAPWTGAAGTVHSASAKAGVWTMTKTLAIEWAKYGITVNDIAPGPTETEGAKGALWSEPGAYERIKEGIPLKRFGSVEEIAWAAVFLASEAANFITGATLVVDGGAWIAGRRY
ncbi:MAG: SDR family oxidoreductase [Chloroflexi bacterium]|nr:SDR family oxidoreductase [Chloroflexota bacterium]